MSRPTPARHLFVVLALVAPTILAAVEDAAITEPASRTFDLIYRATVEDIPADADRVEVWIPYPRSDEHQHVEVVSVETPVPYEIETEPDFGNEVLHFAVTSPQSSSLEIVMRARVGRQEWRTSGYESSGGAANGEVEPTARPEIAKWLEPDELVPLSERIRNLAVEITEGEETDLEKARAIYDYVVETMSYNKEGTGWGRGDIYWACDAKRGNCTDFHALFTGLMRATGIPAKFAIGFPVPPERGSGEIGGYHCWSEFYLDGFGWVPVDASEAAKHPDKKEYFFGAHDENRVEFTEGRDLELRPRQDSDPINFFVYPHVEIDGEVHEGVSLEFRYEDIQGREDVATAGSS